MTPSRIAFHTDDRNGGTLIEKGAYALIVTGNNELRFIVPQTVKDDVEVPQLALALIAVATKLNDSDWVQQLLNEEYGEVRN